MDLITKYDTMRGNQFNNTNEGDRKIRSRFCGMMESKTGKAVGVMSLVAPVLGFILNDSCKPNKLYKS